MSVLRGDFIGFTFNGVHSSDLGIMRVSNGDRYEIDLSPSFTDRTSHIQGSDETYYFDTNCTSKTHKIDIAFDSITEKQIRRLKQLFSPKAVGRLIYDETPYKYYIAKCANVPNLKYLCFDNEVGQRVYKGEGTIELISYYPYAFSRYKYLEDYQVLEDDVDNPYVKIPEWQKNESNLDEWLESSGIISKYFYENGTTLREIDSQFIFNDTPSGIATIYLYNPGDKETYVDFIIGKTGSTMEISISEAGTQAKKYLELNNGNAFNLRGNDNYIKIKSKEGLALGLDSNFKETGNLYNEYLNTSTGFILETLNEPKRFLINPGTSIDSNYYFKPIYNYIYY